MLRIIYITGLLIASLTNANKQNINKEIKEENPENFLCSAPYYDYSEYWYGYERLLRTIIHDYDNLTPSYITFTKDIEFVVLGKTVTYIDFISDDGFVVLDKDTIYEYEKNIDLSKIHESDFAYDPYDKFILKNERGGYEKIFGKNYSDIITTDETIAKTPVLHIGQDVAGDGQIYNLSAYVQNRYPFLSFEQSNYLRYYNQIWQINTSVYALRPRRVVNGIEDEDYADMYVSEGNCVINATYSLLRNLVGTIDYSYHLRQYYPSFYPGIMLYDYSSEVYSDPLYPYYGCDSHVLTETRNDGYQYNWYWNINTYPRVEYNINGPIINGIPHLYLQLRDKALEYNYSPVSGMFDSKIKDLIQYVDGLYGYDISVYNSASFGEVAQNIQNGIPSIVCTSGSETYGNHVMVVYGYALYSVVFENQTLYFYFLAVDSGWGYSDYSGEEHLMWFDMNQSSSLTFKTVSVPSLMWPGC